MSRSSLRRVNEDALRAAETAAVEGTSIEVIDARSIAPLDIEVMANPLRRPAAWS